MAEPKEGANAPQVVTAARFAEYVALVEYLAEQPTSEDAPCHKGLCPAAVCSRCKWIIRARRLLGVPGA